MDLSEDSKQLVLAFYNSNEVSWQAPGRKDRVIICETCADGSKYKLMEQLRLYANIAERSPSPVFHSAFCNNIGLSKFCELRPSNLKLFEHTPHNICVCSYNENVRLMLVALKQQERMKKVPVLKLLDLKKMKYLMKVSSHLQLAIGF